MVLHDFLKDLFAKAELSEHLATSRVSKLVLKSSNYLTETQLYQPKTIKNIK
jgi:hypothetical protein